MRRHSGRVQKTVRSPVDSIDDDVGGLVGAAAADLYVVEVDSGVAEARELDAPALVVADRADIFRAQAERGRGHHRARHLASRTDDFRRDRRFPAVGREMRNQN